MQKSPSFFFLLSPRPLPHWPHAGAPPPPHRRRGLHGWAARRAARRGRERRRPASGTAANARRGGGPAGWRRGRGAAAALRDGGECAARRPARRGRGGRRAGPQGTRGATAALQNGGATRRDPVGRRRGCSARAAHDLPGPLTSSCTSRDKAAVGACTRRGRGLRVGGRSGRRAAGAARVGARRSRGADDEDDKTPGLFCIYSYPLKGYGPKWHNLTSLGCQISILRVCGPKWHLETSSRTAGVFNSI